MPINFKIARITLLFITLFYLFNKFIRKEQHLNFFVEHKADLISDNLELFSNRTSNKDTQNNECKTLAITSEGRNEGVKEGRNEGVKEGRNEGVKEGMKE